MANFIFKIIEKESYYARAKASDAYAALETIAEDFNNGGVDRIAPTYDESSVEFRPCCQNCGFDFEDLDDLEIVDEGFPDERLMCTMCIGELGDGTLTRCNCCGSLFSPAFLKLNTKTENMEICPYCGEIWCE